MATCKHDVLIIGSGAAGLTVALNLPSSTSIGVLSKGKLTSASTFYAQGGVAAVLDKADSLESHVKDTHIAGAFLCHDDAVRQTVENGPDAIRWLIDLGVDFTKLDEGDGGEFGYHLTREGGHSHRRIIHADDATGHAISTALITKARQRDNIIFYEDRQAVDLITEGDNEQKRCVGAYVHHIGEDKTDTFLARFVVLAAGGASKVYLYTSNPDTATGDGIAMGWRAGCRVANMEFMQFHPTCLYHPQAKSFLVSEALRGEGAKLLLPNGERFMHRFDDRAELAPRDVVARAIDHEMKRLGSDCVYLDISHRPDDFIINHFPTIYAKCLQLGFDMTREPIPVVPGAHYTCGGLMTNLNGETDIPSLYAIGESSFTGLHGANRMASNSLLECFIFGKKAAEHITPQLTSAPEPAEPAEWDETQVQNSDEDVVISHNWDELRRFMWDYVGIVRTNKRLARAWHRACLLDDEIHEYYANYRISKNLLELRNLVTISKLIIKSAASRHESRGLHYSLDYPQTDETGVDTVLTPGSVD